MATRGWIAARRSRCCCFQQSCGAGAVLWRAAGCFSDGLGCVGPTGPKACLNESPASAQTDRTEVAVGRVLGVVRMRIKWGRKAPAMVWPPLAPSHRRQLGRWWRQRFWSRGGRSFLEIEGKKEAHSTRVQRRRLLFQARVLIPMAAKDRAGF